MTEITTEMIERAAEVEYGNDPVAWPSGLALYRWTELTHFQRDQYRIRARRVLAAALDKEDRDVT